jgi:spermidine synthase
VDGVLHTAWNSRLGVTGAVWDPLGLAALLAARRRSALLLGVGGGAAVHLLRRHAGVERIVGIEREAALVAVAREHFDLGGPGVELVCDDAAAWVAGHRRARFDVVIDDVFGERGREPVRALGGAAWWRRVASLVAPGGVLVVNFTELGLLRASGLLGDAVLRRGFRSFFRFSCPGYTNAIVAFARDEVSRAEFLRRVRAVPTLRPAATRRALRFGVHEIRPSAI